MGKGLAKAIDYGVHQRLHDYAAVVKQQTMDKVCITLGQMGFEPEKFREFDKVFKEVERDFNFEVLEDLKADKHLEYSKAVIDRTLKQYIPEDLFVPFEERYR